MQGLLRFSSLIDELSRKIGVIADWTVLIAVLISAGNAITRYTISLSSNAWLEIQWYLFAGTVMLGASYTLRRNEHVRVDIVYSAVGTRTQHWIDLLGGILFLLPTTILMAWLSWPLFALSFAGGEMSNNAGGLIRWPVKLLVPLGFALLTLQGISEVIKRWAALRGLIVIESKYERPVQ